MSDLIVQLRREAENVLELGDRPAAVAASRSLLEAADRLTLLEAVLSAARPALLELECIGSKIRPIESALAEAIRACDSAQAKGGEGE